MHSSQVVITLMPRAKHCSHMVAISFSKLNSVTTAISASHSLSTASASARIGTLMGPMPANTPASMPTTSGFTSMAPTI